MFNMIDLEVADYVLTMDEPRYLEQGEEAFFVDYKKLVFRKIFVNPFCIMMIEPISDPVNGISPNKISMLVLSDGNKFIINTSPENMTSRLQVYIDTAYEQLPF